MKTKFLTAIADTCERQYSPAMMKENNKGSNL
jgi:hypothetical protein